MRRTLFAAGIFLTLGFIPSSADNKNLYPRTKEEIQKEIQALSKKIASEKVTYTEQPSNTKANPKAGKIDDASLQAALARLKIYRYLVGVPYQDITIKDSYTDYAQHAAVLMSIMKTLSHNPKKPDGVPDAFFKPAATGASKCNLSSYAASLVHSIDRFMDDSDPRNILELGHRRWCLNPAMQETGFGYIKNFAAMWAMDANRKPTPDYDIIAFPARGYYPVAYFGADWAWNVSLNPAKYEKPSSAEVKIYPAEKPGVKAKQPLTLSDVNVAQKTRGVPICIIFRPRKITVAAGAQYWVEISGIRKKDGGAAPIEYLVEFF